MKKYLNNALFFKEWRITKVLIAMFFILQICVGTLAFKGGIDGIKFYIKNWANMSNDGIQTQEIYYVFYKLFSDDSMIAVGIGIIIIACILMGLDRSNNFKYLSTMPFSRDEIIDMKWRIGIFIIVIPTIINFVIISLMYFSNLSIFKEAIKLKAINGIFSYNFLVKWFVLSILIYIFIFAVLMFINSLCGNGIAAGILGGVVLIFPIGFTELIKEFIAMNIGSSFNYENFKGISKLADSLCPVLYRELPGYNGTVIFKFNNFGLKCGVLLICIVVCYLLSKYFFQKNAFEKSGNIFMFKSLEPIFKIGVAVCFGLLFPLMTDSFINRGEYNERIIAIIVDVLFIVFTAIFYFVAKKVIEFCRN